MPLNVCDTLRGGGVTSIRARNAAKPPSFMSLIPLWLAALKRPARFGRGRKAGDVSDPPPKKQGGHAAFRRGTLSRTSTRPPWGRSRPHLSLREGLGKTPFPLALHCVGSVRAVKGSLRRFAPWTAPGRSERRAAYEGKGGDRAVWCSGRVASPLAHDKGYYHSYCGRTRRKEPFGHTRRLSRSRGALSPVGP